jgi:hypothetical protein
MCSNDALLRSLFFLFLHLRHLLPLQNRSFWRLARLKWLRRSRIVYNSNTPPTLSQIKLWQMFTSTKICKLVSILIKAVKFTIIFRMLTRFKFGVYWIMRSASYTSNLLVNFIWEMFAQYLLMAEKTLHGMTMFVTTIDSRPLHNFIALSIPSSDTLPWNGNTNRLRFGVLKYIYKTHIIQFFQSWILS